MPGRARAKTVAWSDERAARCDRVDPAIVTELDPTIEDRQLAAGVDRSKCAARPQHEPEAREEQHESREQSGEHDAPLRQARENEECATALRCRGHRRRCEHHRRCRGGELARRSADRVEELTRRRVLENDACRAGIERSVADAGIEGKEHDAGVGEQGAQASRDFEAVHLGHRVVEHDQIGTQLERLLQGLGAIRGLADDQEVGLGLEHRTNALAYSEVIVRQQDPRCHSPGAPYRDRQKTAPLSRLVSPPLRHR